MDITFANNSNLVATDHLGRKLPRYGEVREKRKDKIVGLFYYLWLGYHGTQGPFDISKILEEDPKVLDKPDSPLWPDETNAPMMHWGEPMFGYYLSTDEWVLRRHVQMFIDAGIDVLYFDVTNGFTYRKTYLKLFKILSEYKAKGFAAPQVCFYLAPQTRGCGTGNMMELWEQLYEPMLYPELWFYWKGKPLIICHSQRAIPEEIRDFFTWRAPTWNAPQMENTWAWEGNPQKVAVDEHGNPEQIAASVVANDCAPDAGELSGSNMSDAYWGTPIYGRSWHNGAKDKRENASHYGFFFQEQLNTALKIDPPVTFICQWNEWLVPMLTKNSVCVPPYDYKNHHFVFRDEFNEEYSRDIEPMKGGYKDAYYLQMTAFCRKFKGMEKPATDTRKHVINVSKDFSQWNSVALTYREYTGDVEHRNFKAYDAVGRYENDTGRNEFSVLKVANDKKNVYFYAECSNKITSKDDKNWMTLFLRLDEKMCSWEGYNFVINRVSPEGDKAVLEICSQNGEYEWRKIALLDYRCTDNKLQLAVPKSVLGILEKNFCIEFKWSDNMQHPDVMDFYVNGDAAPRGRMNYLYIFEAE